MAPAFATGDLVILRKDGAVGVGDIAGYRSGLTGQIVVHRVIAENGGLLTFKGDNNWWIDTYRPTQHEVVGKLWLHKGGAGKQIKSVHPSWVLGGIAGVIGMTLATSGAQESARGRKRSLPQGLSFVGSGAQAVIAGLGLIAAVAGILALMAFRVDTTTTVQKLVDAQHKGAFSYASEAPLSPVYDTGRVLTGDPILTDLLHTVAQDFTYTLEAPGAENVRGTIRLAAVIRDVNGWEREYDIVPITAFEGPEGSVGATLAVSDITTFISSIQDTMGTGVRYWTIAITAEVLVSGTIEGHPFESHFEPFYTFRVVPPNEIYVETSLTRDFESAPPLATSGRSDLFNPVLDLVIPVPKEEPAQMSLLFVHIRVDRLRIIAGVGAIVALVATAVVGMVTLRALRVPSCRIYARYGSKLVRVSAITVPSDAATMLTMADLARVADRYRSVILWSQDGDDDVYAVQEGGSTYVYRGAALAAA